MANGIKIGEVSGMRLGPNYSAVVDLRIDVPLELPTDTSAAIHTDGLFGDKHVVLVPGAEDKILRSGGSITLKLRPNDVAPGLAGAALTVANDLEIVAAEILVRDIEVGK